MKRVRRILLVCGLLVVGSMLTACSEVVDTIKEQFKAEEEILAYLDDTNPIIEAGVIVEREAVESAFEEEDVERGYAFLVEKTMPSLEKLVGDTESVEITWEQLQPAHDKLIEAHQKLLEAYLLYAEGFELGDENKMLEGDAVYEEHVAIFDEHLALFSELAEEYNVKIEIEEIE